VSNKSDYQSKPCLQSQTITYKHVRLTVHLFIQYGMGGTAGEAILFKKLCQTFHHQTQNLAERATNCNNTITKKYLQHITPRPWIVPGIGPLHNSLKLLHLPFQHTSSSCSHKYWLADMSQRGLEENTRGKQRGDGLKHHHPHLSWGFFVWLSYTELSNSRWQNLRVSDPK
jgi:hypothetical protein